MSIFVRKADPRELDARVLRDELSATLAMLTGDSRQFRNTAENFLSPRACFVLARAFDGRPRGSGAFARHAYRVAEITQIFARAETYGTDCRERRTNSSASRRRYWAW